MPNESIDRRKLVIGSCPGRGFFGNPFICEMLDMLDPELFELRSFAGFDDIDPEGLDILLIHWPEKFFYGPQHVNRVMGALRVLGRFARLPRRCRLVWLVHDLDPVQPRANKALWPLLRRTFAHRADAFLTLSPSTIDVVRSAIPGLARTPASWIYHPPYQGVAMTRPDRDQLRAKRGIRPDDTVLGYVGILQPYKRVGDILDAFEALDRPDLWLYLAGREPCASERDRFLAAAAKNPRIVLEFGALSDDGFRDAVAVLDRFVAPMRGYLHSGSLVYAASAHVPLLTRRTPYASDLARAIGSDWVSLFEGTLDAATLGRFADSPQPAEEPRLDRLSDRANAERLNGFLADLASPKRAKENGQRTPSPARSKSAVGQGSSAA